MANRYGCRKVLHDAGFEIPYEYVPDGMEIVFVFYLIVSALLLLLLCFSYV